MHSSVLCVTWTVTPIHPPFVWRNCPSCRVSRPFACTGDFRTNAQKKRVDIWLIYRCRQCDARWNLPLFERILVTDLPRDRFDAIARNDDTEAARYAFDLGRLTRHSHRVEDAPGVEIVKQHRPTPADTSAIEIALTLAWPSLARLDQVLAQELGIARSRLQTWQQSGILDLAPAHGKALRTRLADGQRIRFALATLDAAERDLLLARA